MSTYRIATVTDLDKYKVINTKVKVMDDIFWKSFEDKVRELTKDRPDLYEETLQKAKEQLSITSLTIIDTWFEMKSKK